MPVTNSRKINMYEKRLLSLTALRENFLDFLVEQNDENIAAIFQGTSGVLDGDVIGLAASGNDEFDLDLTNANRVVVGGGQVIDLSQITGAGITVDIPFENTNLTAYYVGIRYAEVEIGLELNPRTGDPEYPQLKQTYGELDNPDSLTDTFQSNLRVFINNITQSGVDHSGRTVRVWLVDPQAPTEAIAFFTGTSAYSAPDNYVDIPYSAAAGPLGQDVTSNPPSTTPADYKVFIEGASWTTVDIRTDQTYAFIGIITGNGPATPPAVFDTGDQIPIFINTLDRAYDGASGSGSGRLMFVDGGAVEARSRSGTTDDHRASVRIDRKGDSQKNGIGLQIITRGEGTGADPHEAAGLLVAVPMNQSTDLQIDEGASSNGGDELNFTRTPLLQTANVRPGDLLWLQEGSGWATLSGLYIVNFVNSQTQIEVRDIDGATPSSWPVESGTVTILRVKFISGEPRFGGGAYPQLQSNSMSGDNTLTSDAVLKLFPFESAVAVAGYDNADPPVQRWEFDNNGQLTIKERLLVQGTDASIVSFEQASAQYSLKADTEIPGKMTDHAAVEWERIEAIGRRAKPHTWEDDFIYNSSSWTGGNPPAHRYVENTVGAASQSLATTVAGGVVELETDVLTGDNIELRTGAVWSPRNVADSGGNRPSRLRFMARHRLMTTLADRIDRIGFGFGASWHIVIERDTDAADSDWFVEVFDGTNTKRAQITGSAPTADTFQNFYLSQVSDTSIAAWVSGASAEVVLTIGGGSEPTAFTNAAYNATGYLFARVEDRNNAARESQLDYWKAWNDVILSG
jgi:hypothetical protein